MGAFNEEGAGGGAVRDVRRAKPSAISTADATGRFKNFKQHHRPFSLRQDR